MQARTVFKRTLLFAALTIVSPIFTASFGAETSLQDLDRDNGLLGRMASYQMQVGQELDLDAIFDDDSKRICGHAQFYHAAVGGISTNLEKLSGERKERLRGAVSRLEHAVDHLRNETCMSKWSRWNNEQTHDVLAILIAYNLLHDDIHDELEAVGKSITRVSDSTVKPGVGSSGAVSEPSVAASAR